MKKFMKGCAVTALIMLVLGFGVATVVSLMGGTGKVEDLVQSVTHGKLNLDLTFDGDWGLFIGESDVLFDIDEETMFDKDYEIIEEDVDKYSVGSNIENLNIQVGGCSFYVKESVDENIYVEATNAGKFQCFCENGTLYIKSSRTVVDGWDKFDDSVITLSIPTSQNFGKVEAGLGAGLLKMFDIVANEMNLEVGAGQISMDHLQANSCNIEVGMGEIIVKEMQVTNLDAEVGMGHLQVDGIILGDVDAECSMGSIEFNLTGREEDFNYNLEAAMGNVSIGSEKYSGLTSNRTIKNSASKNMSIECSMGNIEVNFEE